MVEVILLQALASNIDVDKASACAMASVKCTIRRHRTSDSSGVISVHQNIPHSLFKTSSRLLLIHNLVHTFDTKSHGLPCGLPLHLTLEQLLGLLRKRRSLVFRLLHRSIDLSRIADFLLFLNHCAIAFCLPSIPEKVNSQLSTCLTISHIQITRGGNILCRILRLLWPLKRLHQLNRHSLQTPRSPPSRNSWRRP